MEERRKAELVLKKFNDLARLHLETLNQRKESIKRCRRISDLNALQREKAHADLIVRQLCADVQNMFDWCSDLSPDIAEWVVQQARPLNCQIQAALADFHNNESDIRVRPLTRRATFDENEPISNGESVSNQEPIGTLQKVGDDKQALKEELEKRQQEAETHERLMKDILELEDLMKNMATLVHTQREAVDSIEDNVDKALSNVKHGERHLIKTVRAKTASYPLAGAIVGAASAAGPLGLLIGLKVAVVAAVGGSALGAIAGHLVKKKVNDDLDTNTHEMQRLTESCDNKKSD